MWTDREERGGSWDLLSSFIDRYDESIKANAVKSVLYGSQAYRKDKQVKDKNR